MKFFASVAVYVLFALFLGWGIVSLVHGNPWILVAGLMVYVFLMVRIGCLPESH